MPAARCPLCLVNYPAGVQCCAHCDEQTQYIATDRPDSPEDIKLKQGYRENQPRNDPVRWRMTELLRMGLDLEHAQAGAHDKFDLHTFADYIKRGATPLLAYEVLRS